MRYLIRKFMVFLFYGFIWLFIFSLPVSPGISVYSWCYSHIVDSTPVHYIMNKLPFGKDEMQDIDKAEENSTHLKEDEIPPAPTRKREHHHHKPEKRPHSQL